MTKETQKGKIDYIEFPVKSVEDMKKTKSFYSKIFGWEYQDWGEDYADTKDSGLGSGLNVDRSHKTKQPLAVIYVKDIETKKDEVVKAGGKIEKDIFSFPGGRRFHFVDPAGNELAVWSDK
jgi:uncharacterized protein